MLCEFAATKAPPPNLPSTSLQDPASFDQLVLPTSDLARLSYAAYVSKLQVERARQHLPSRNRLLGPASSARGRNGRVATQRTHVKLKVHANPGHHGLLGSHSAANISTTYSRVCLTCQSSAVQLLLHRNALGASGMSPQGGVGEAEHRKHIRLKAADTAPATGDMLRASSSTMCNKGGIALHRKYVKLKSGRKPYQANRPTLRGRIGSVRHSPHFRGKVGEAMTTEVMHYPRKGIG